MNSVNVCGFTNQIAKGIRIDEKNIQTFFVQSHEASYLLNLVKKRLARTGEIFPANLNK